MNKEKKDCQIGRHLTSSQTGRKMCLRRLPQISELDFLLSVDKDTDTIGKPRQKDDNHKVAGTDRPKDGRAL